MYLVFLIICFINSSCFFKLSIDITRPLYLLIIAFLLCPFSRSKYFITGFLFLLIRCLLILAAYSVPYNILLLIIITKPFSFIFILERWFIIKSLALFVFPEPTFKFVIIVCFPIYFIISISSVSCNSSIFISIIGIKLY